MSTWRRDLLELMLSMFLSPLRQCGAFSSLRRWRRGFRMLAYFWMQAWGIVMGAEEIFCTELIQKIIAYGCGSSQVVVGATGNQLQTLNDSSNIYEGNQALCGTPLLAQCPDDEASQGSSSIGCDGEDKDEEDGSETLCERVSLQEKDGIGKKPRKDHGVSEKVEFEMKASENTQKVIPVDQEEEEVQLPEVEEEAP
ncbi:hypothetical protein HHK36_029445 [Tetracentron sinense]|uniref:Uncharacterized protein n=1 Tax=Tetracentron sinense TaxID=13715 RepID=A0A834YBB8_TETSI|nr:hypothetical protein HHK36_029445 [Tetracentron sinense]